VAWLRRGTWHPTRGTWAAPLLAVQLVLLGQALLRGADYIRLPGGRVPPDLLLLVPPPMWAWGLLFGISAVAGLVGIAGHWGYLVAVGHCGVAVAYSCVGIALLDAADIDQAWRVVLGAILAAFGAALARLRPPSPRRFAAVRALCVALLVAGVLGIVDGMGHDFRTASGQIAAACVHGILGVSILRTVQRQKIRARLTDQS
jgi:hypothetical protein